MAEIVADQAALTAEDRDRMHTLYRQGGEERQMAPHIVYPTALCPHDDCDQPMQAIDFRLEDHGRAVHDPLVRAWWSDLGFVGRCPRCGGWVHFTIRGKSAITAADAAGYPQLPDDWHKKATIL
jgi:hypothetical protein